MPKKKKKQFKIKKKTRRGLLAGAVTIPITFGLMSKGSQQLGNIGAGLEKGLGGFGK